MIKMKMFNATIEAVTMDAEATNVVRTTTETIVPAESRGDAILVALDMGQAMARSANHCDTDIAVYFRIINVVETDEGIT